VIRLPVVLRDTAVFLGMPLVSPADSIPHVVKKIELISFRNVNSLFSRLRMSLITYFNNHPRLSIEGKHQLTDAGDVYVM
jgi:hypothetical protein